MSMSIRRVSVIMPALDEEPNIVGAMEDVVEGFDRFSIAGELIIINDGSRDGTGEIADAFSTRHPGIRVIHHSSPQGIGASFMEGVKEATGDAVVMIPGDGENNAPDILRYVALLEHVDIVNPYICNPGMRSPGRRLLSYCFKMIVNISFGLSFRCVTGTVMYRKAVLEDMVVVSRGFFYQPELLIRATRRGYLFAEVPYFLNKRRGGISKSATVKSFVNIVHSYLRTAAAVYAEDGKKVRISPQSVTSIRLKEHP